MSGTSGDIPVWYKWWYECMV